MAETLISPGVLAREIDQSQVSSLPVAAGAAIIGPTVKGPVEIPTVVTSYSDYQNKFGTSFTSGSSVYTYFTSIAAYNYFNNGGDSLLVSRVVAGGGSTYSPATTATASVDDCAILNANGDEALILETLSEGTIMNSVGPEDSDGALASGSANNIRWQVTARDTGSGTFALLVRRGDDLTDQQNVLETWTNLSMDPTAPNYVAKVIGDYTLGLSADNSQIEISGSYPNFSNYIRIKSVETPTPNYFDNTGNAKTQYTSSIPVNASGSFGDATGNMEANAGNKYYNNIISGVTNSQGLTGSDYSAMITLLSNQDAYQYNVLSAPGLFDTANVTNAEMVSKISTLISNTQNRGDYILVIDQNLYGSTIGNAVTAAATRNTSYAATYWPWLQTVDPDTGQNVWVPASTMIPGVYAQNDSVSYAWFAPAGINRGGLSNVVRAEKTLTQANRDTLYTNKVNPIATFPGTGVVVYGQKTLQTKASALDRVNVRRLLIELKSFISQVANNLVFEQNTIATRNRFLSQVNPYLEQVQQQQGLYAFRVIMDDSNNTADVIDRNQLIGQIYVQPTKTAEFIYLDFTILPTGAVFPA